MKFYASLIPLILLAGCGGGSEPGAEAPATVAQVRTGIAEAGASSDDVSVYGATEAGPGGEQSVVAPAEAIIASIVAPTGTAVGAGPDHRAAAAQPDHPARHRQGRQRCRGGAGGLCPRAAAACRRPGQRRRCRDRPRRRRNRQCDARQSRHQGRRACACAHRSPAPYATSTAKPGDQLAAGATLATVAAQGDLRARFGVDPVLAQRVHPGQPIGIDTVNGTAPATVTVVGIDPQIDPTTRLASVYVRIPAALHLGAGEPLRATLAGRGGEHRHHHPLCRAAR